LFVFVLISFKMGSYAQIYVDSSGKVGLHTSTTSTGADVFVYGSFRIGNDYGTNINFSSDYGNTVITPGGNNQGYIGTSTKQFSTVRAQYHYATTTLLTSDKRLKENFRSTVTKAVMYIYNMQGEQILQLPVTERGNTSATIEGNSLKAGIYLYTLIADGNKVYTKR